MVTSAFVGFGSTSVSYSCTTSSSTNICLLTIIMPQIKKFNPHQPPCLHPDQKTAAWWILWSCIIEALSIAWCHCHCGFFSGLWDADDIIIKFDIKLGIHFALIHMRFHDRTRSLQDKITFDKPILGVVIEDPFTR